MAIILFDKMLAARRLETDSPFTRQQAEILAEVYHDAMTQSVATKSDMESIRAGVKTDIESLRTSVRTDIENLRTSVQVVESELKLLEARMLAAIAESSSRTIVTVLGFTVPLLIASGLLQHFWK